MTLSIVKNVEVKRNKPNLTTITQGAISQLLDAGKKVNSGEATLLSALLVCDDERLLPGVYVHKVANITEAKVKRGAIFDILSALCGFTEEQITAKRDSREKKDIENYIRVSAAKKAINKVLPICTYLHQWKEEKGETPWTVDGSFNLYIKGEALGIMREDKRELLIAIDGSLTQSITQLKKMTQKDNKQEPSHYDKGKNTKGESLKELVGICIGKLSGLSAAECDAELKILLEDLYLATAGVFGEEEGECIKELKRVWDKAF